MQQCKWTLARYEMAYNLKLFLKDGSFHAVDSDAILLMAAQWPYKAAE